MISYKRYLSLIFCFAGAIQAFDSKCSSLSIQSIYNLLPNYPQIEYIKCQDASDFEYKPLSISKYLEIQPCKGILAETFILKIPQGIVFGQSDYVKVDNFIIEETAVPFFNRLHRGKISYLWNNKTNLISVKGRVAIISAHYYGMYGHWLYNCLGRLALLDAYNIDYDYIYVPSDKKYIKETLILWGIDEGKIIEQKNKNEWLQADELIVTSFIGRRAPHASQETLPFIPIDLYCKQWQTSYFPIPGNIYYPADKAGLSSVNLANVFMKWAPLCAFYPDKFIIDYIRQKFISQLPKDIKSRFSKRVFVSRKDTTYRLCHNEDEVFAVFAQYGYERYNLSQLSMLENIELFYNAEAIAGLSGSGMTQLLFCQPNTKIIEIFMDFAEACFCYLSQELSLEYCPLKTKEFCTFGFDKNNKIDVDVIRSFLQKNN